MSEKEDKQIEGFWVVLLKVLTDPVNRSLETVSAMTILGVLFFFAVFAILLPLWLALLTSLALLGLVGWIEHLNKRIALLKKIGAALQKARKTTPETDPISKKRKESSTIRFLLEMVAGLSLLKLVLFAIDSGPLTRWNVFSVSLGFFGLLAAPILYYFWRMLVLLESLIDADRQTLEVLGTFFGQLASQGGGVQNNQSDQPHPAAISGGSSQIDGGGDHG